MTLIFQNVSAILIKTFLQTFISYIDPGSGMSAIGAILAIVASLGLSIFGFFWYLIKKLLGSGNDDQEPKPEIDEEG